MGENRFQGPGPLRPANDRAREPYPQPTAGEPTEQDASPAGFDELEFPDEITLLLPEGPEPTMQQFERALFRAGLAADAAGITHPSLVVEEMVCCTKQGPDTWYAGVPRGDRLVLRRI